MPENYIITLPDRIAERYDLLAFQQHYEVPREEVEELLCDIVATVALQNAKDATRLAALEKNLRASNLWDAYAADTPGFIFVKSPPPSFWDDVSRESWRRALDKALPDAWLRVLKANAWSYEVTDPCCHTTLPDGQDAFGLKRKEAPADVRHELLIVDVDRKIGVRLWSNDYAGHFLITSHAIRRGLLTSNSSPPEPGSLDSRVFGTQDGKAVTPAGWGLYLKSTWRSHLMSPDYGTSALPEDLAQRLRALAQKGKWGTWSTYDAGGLCVFLRCTHAVNRPESFAVHLVRYNGTEYSELEAHFNDSLEAISHRTRLAICNSEINVKQLLDGLNLPDNPAATFVPQDPGVHYLYPMDRVGQVDLRAATRFVMHPSMLGKFQRSYNIGPRGYATAQECMLGALMLLQHLRQVALPTVAFASELPAVCKNIIYMGHAQVLVSPALQDYFPTFRPVITLSCGAHTYGQIYSTFEDLFQHHRVPPLSRPDSPGTYVVFRFTNQGVTSTAHETAAEVLALLDQWYAAEGDSADYVRQASSQWTQYSSHEVRAFFQGEAFLVSDGTWFLTSSEVVTAAMQQTTQETKKKVRMESKTLEEVLASMPEDGHGFLQSDGGHVALRKGNTLLLIEDALTGAVWRTERTQGPPSFIVPNGDEGRVASLKKRAWSARPMESSHSFEPLLRLANLRVDYGVTVLEGALLLLNKVPSGPGVWMLDGFAVSRTKHRVTVYWAESLKAVYPYVYLDLDDSGRLSVLGYNEKIAEDVVTLARAADALKRGVLPQKIHEDGGLPTTGVQRLREEYLKNHPGYGIEVYAPREAQDTLYFGGEEPVALYRWGDGVGSITATLLKEPRLSMRFTTAGAPMSDMPDGWSARIAKQTWTDPKPLPPAHLPEVKEGVLLSRLPSKLVEALVQLRAECAKHRLREDGNYISQVEGTLYHWSVECREAHPTYHLLLESGHGVKVGYDEGYLVLFDHIGPAGLGSSPEKIDRLRECIASPKTVRVCDVSTPVNNTHFINATEKFKEMDIDKQRKDLAVLFPDNGALGVGHAYENDTVILVGESIHDGAIRSLIWAFNKTTGEGKRLVLHQDALPDWAMIPDAQPLTEQTQSKDPLRLRGIVRDFTCSRKTYESGVADTLILLSRMNAGSYVCPDKRLILQVRDEGLDVRRFTVRDMGTHVTCNTFHGHLWQDNYGGTADLELVRAAREAITSFEPCDVSPDIARMCFLANPTPCAALQTLFEGADGYRHAYRTAIDQSSGIMHVEHLFIKQVGPHAKIVYERLGRRTWYEAHKLGDNWYAEHAGLPSLLVEGAWAMEASTRPDFDKLDTNTNDKKLHEKMLGVLDRAGLVGLEFKVPEVRGTLFAIKPGTNYSLSEASRERGCYILRLHNDELTNPRLDSFGDITFSSLRAVRPLGMAECEVLTSSYFRPNNDALSNLVNAVGRTTARWRTRWGVVSSSYYESTRITMLTLPAHDTFPEDIIRSHALAPSGRYAGDTTWAWGALEDMLSSYRDSNNHITDSHEQAGEANANTPPNPAQEAETPASAPIDTTPAETPAKPPETEGWVARLSEETVKAEDEVFLRRIGEAVTALATESKENDMSQDEKNQTEKNQTETPAPETGLAARAKDAAKAALRTGKEEAHEAAWRTATKQFVKLVREPLVAVMAKQAGKEADEGFKKQLADFLMTEAGTTMLTGVLSIGLTAIPGESNPQVARLAKELRVNAMANTADLMADVVMGPLRQVVSAFIQGNPLPPAEPPQLPAASTEGLPASVLTHLDAAPINGASRN